MVVKIKRFGWIADLPDHRDLMYAATEAGSNCTSYNNGFDI